MWVCVCVCECVGVSVCVWVFVFLFLHSLWLSSRLTVSPPLHPQLSRAYPIECHPSQRTPVNKWYARVASLVHPSVLAQQIKFVGDSWLHRCPRVGVLLALHKEVSSVDFRFGRSAFDPGSRSSGVAPVVKEKEQALRQQLSATQRVKPAKVSLYAYSAASIRSATAQGGRRPVPVPPPQPSPREPPGRGRRIDDLGQSSLSTLSADALRTMQRAVPAWLLESEEGEEGGGERQQPPSQHESLAAVDALGYKCPYPGCAASFKTLRTMQLHHKLHEANAEIVKGVSKRRTVSRA